MNRLYFLFLTLLTAFPALADSKTGHPETDALLDSAKTYVFDDNAKAFVFASKLETLAKKLGNSDALAYAHLYYGVIDESHGDMDNALENYNKGLKFAAKSKNKEPELRILIAMSTYYTNLSDFKSCITTCHKGIRKSLAVDNKELASQFYNNLALCHSYMSDYENALKYNDKSIELKKDLNDENGLANTYLNRGLFLTNTGNYKEGFVFYRKAEELYLKLKNHTALTQLYINFGWDYSDLKDFKLARAFLSKAMHHSKKANDKIREAGVWNALGHYYRQKGETDSLTFALETGLRLSFEANNLRNSYAATKELAEHYRQTGQLEKALEYNEQAQQMKDSILDETRLKLTQSLNARYETKQKELTIAGQNTELARRNLWIVIIASLALFIIVALFIFQYRRRVQAQKAEVTKINLAVYESEQNERIRIARELHDGLGQLLSTARLNVAGLEESVPEEDVFLVDNACKLLDDAVIEVRTVSHNMMPIALTQLGLIPAINELVAKINDSKSIAVNFETNIVERLNPAFEITVYRVIQEVVNNAIKHSRAKNLVIELKRKENKMLLRISDDGQGFDTENIQNSKGLGWKSIFSRISMFNGEIDVRSSKEKGTEFVIFIPL